MMYMLQGWLHSTVVERRSLAGELTLPCTIVGINDPLQVIQPGQLSFLFFQSR